jgi:RHS repeat-associated protein
LADGSQWVYEYDKLGQVKSGKRYWNDATPVAGQQFEYTFDDIGNRTVSKAGGDENGANLRSTTYATDLLNRYVSRTASSTAVDVIGAAKATASVTINTVPVTTRKGEYYWMEFPVDVSAAADYPSISVTATEGANQNTSSGNLFVPQNPEMFQDGVTPGYDEDGNPLRDGRWTYTWDAENRLTKIESRTEHLGPLPAAGRKIECEYDYLGRRIRKKTSAWNPGPENWNPPTERKFVYDGWNLVGIFDANNALLQSFAWGSDLSGTMQGAGGVGGLLSMTVHSGANAGTYFYAYDGNGNVAALVNAADGVVVARYEYGPFGEVIRATGPLAKENPFRFSTKYQDDETDLLYYGYRYYNASTGRWLGRDPLGERGGRNLYGFVGNVPMVRIDRLGLEWAEDEYGYPIPPSPPPSKPKDPDDFDYPWWVDVVDIACDVGSAISIGFDVATIPSGEGALATSGLQACKYKCKKHVKDKIVCNQMYDAMKAICGQPHSCNENGHPPAYYAERLAAAIACEGARAAYQKKCWKPKSDPRWEGHMQKIAEESRAIKKCSEQLTKATAEGLK